MRLIPVIAWTVALALPASAGSVPQFTSAWFVGDSLTDPGNLQSLTGGRLPPSPPYAGSSTNGPVWAQQVAAAFSARGLETGNFAYSYATSIRNDDLAPGLGRPAALTVQIPDLPDQIESLAAVPKDSLGSAPLVSVWTGANDIFDAIALADPGNPAAAAQSVALAAGAAATAVAQTVAALGAAGFGDVLVFNLPALEATPAFALDTPAAAPLAKFGTDTFNAALAASLGGLKAGPNVIGVDAHAAFEAVLAEPASYGLSNVTTPCLTSAGLCAPEVAATSFFFDGVHPTTVGHGIITDIVLDKVSPVPLPASAWLLVSGLAALAVLSGRRRTA